MRTLPFAVGLVVIGLSAVAGAGSGGAATTADPPFPGFPPAFVAPPGGTTRVQQTSFGTTTTLLRSDGSVYATEDADQQGRPLLSVFDLGNGQSTGIAASYGGPDAAATPRALSRASSCGNNTQNALGIKWSSTENWYFGSGSTPSYLNVANTLTGLRAAHTEWTQNVNWCGIADNSSFNTSYQGTTTQGFGKNGINTIGFGSVAALGLSGCSSSSTIACTEWWNSGSTITEADTRLDNTGRATWVNGSVSGKEDVQSTEAHEMGHTAGFGHVSDSTNVMYPTIFTNDTSNRELGRGDANEDNNKY
jgi:Matrixin